MNEEAPIPKPVYSLSDALWVGEGGERLSLDHVRKMLRERERESEAKVGSGEAHTGKPTAFDRQQEQEQRLTTLGDD